MQYETWYEFKRECEKRLGYSLLNRTWLELKPKSPLPWDDSHLRAVLAAQGYNTKLRAFPGRALRGKNTSDRVSLPKVKFVRPGF